MVKSKAKMNLVFVKKKSLLLFRCCFYKKKEKFRYYIRYKPLKLKIKQPYCFNWSIPNIKLRMYYYAGQKHYNINRRDVA